jgi:hypothetical protein
MPTPASRRHTVVSARMPTPASRGHPWRSMSRTRSVSRAASSWSAPTQFATPAARTPSTPTRMQASPAAAADDYCRWVPTATCTTPDLLLQHLEKYLQHTSKTVKTLSTYVCNTRKTVWGHCKTYATYRWNTCNICVHYATSGWNTCNITVKHMQRSDKTRATYIWNS